MTTLESGPDRQRFYDYNLRVVMGWHKRYEGGRSADLLNLYSNISEILAFPGRHKLHAGALTRLATEGAQTLERYYGHPAQVDRALLDTTNVIIASILSRKGNDPDVVRTVQRHISYFNDCPGLAECYLTHLQSIDDDERTNQLRDVGFLMVVLPFCTNEELNMITQSMPRSVDMYYRLAAQKMLIEDSRPTVSQLPIGDESRYKRSLGEYFNTPQVKQTWLGSYFEGRDTAHGVLATMVGNLQKSNPNYIYPKTVLEPGASLDDYHLWRQKQMVDELLPGFGEGMDLYMDSHEPNWTTRQMQGDYPSIYQHVYRGGVIDALNQWQSNNSQALIGLHGKALHFAME